MQMRTSADHWSWVQDAIIAACMCDTISRIAPSDCWRSSGVIFPSCWFSMRSTTPLIVAWQSGAGGGGGGAGVCGAFGDPPQPASASITASTILVPSGPTVPVLSIRACYYPDPRRDSRSARAAAGAAVATVVGVVGRTGADRGRHALREPRALRRGEKPIAVPHRACGRRNAQAIELGA